MAPLIANSGLISFHLAPQTYNSGFLLLGSFVNFANSFFKFIQADKALFGFAFFSLKYVERFLTTLLLIKLL